MLLNFKVENYRSFGSEQSLSMRPGPVRNHGKHIIEDEGSKALCLAMIFGANSSGKSNLVRAMRDSRNMVSDGTPIPREAYNRRLRSNSSLPTGFEYTIRTGGRVYAYGFEVMLSTGEVVNEWLRLMDHGDGRFVFHRMRTDVETDTLLSDPDSRSTFEVYSRELTANPRELFLRILSRAPSVGKSPLVHAGMVMNWFRTGLNVFPRDSFIPGTQIRPRDEVAEHMLSAFGTGVSGLEYRSVDMGDQLLPEYVMEVGHIIRDDGSEARVHGPHGEFRVGYRDGQLHTERMMTRHGDILFDFTEESDGTQRLYSMVPILDCGEPDDVTYVVDELHRSMHPQLTRRFLSEFLSMCADSRRQLIMTAHESRLLDLNLVRRDEVWFVDKPCDGDSELYSLEEFTERGDRRIDRMYLDGRYGAVPLFERICPDPE